MSDKPKAAKKPSPKKQQPSRLRRFLDQPLRLPTFQINKPKMVIKSGQAAKEAHQQAQSHPLTLWGLAIRLLPVWILIVLILVIEPTLPFQAVGAVVNWGISLLPERPPPGAAEPVFIVERPEGGGAVESDLPPPNWSLEISPVFTPEVAYWRDRIAEWSVAYRIKPNAIATLMQIESCGNPRAVSQAGAQGLFQVMPPHFAEGEDPYDPDINAGRGLLYFGEQLASVNGDSGLAFAAYNGGPSMTVTSPIEWPQETQDYQFWASGIYEDAESGIEESPTLQEWWEAGGITLCSAASDALGLTND